MSSIDASTLLGAGADGYQIERSLRFSSASSKYLNRTPASAGNRKTWSVSFWLKRSALGTYQMPFSCYQSTGGALALIFNTDNTLEFYQYNAAYQMRLVTSQVFRDPSSWYHFVFSVDTTQATASNRVKIYVNGTQITAFSTATYPTQNDDLIFNYAQAHAIGMYAGNNQYYFDGLITEFHNIDGQALTPSSFGETDTITGVWKPKRYSGTYTGNSFYLKFADNSGTTSTTLGKDSSGLGNHFTPNNFSVTAGAGNDSMIDVPTPYADGGNGRGNYATLSPLSKGDDATLANGNLDVSYGSAPFPSCTMATFGMSSGKWYWETTITASSLTNTGGTLGVTNTSNSSYNSVPQYPGYSANGWGYSGNTGTKYNNGTSTAYGSTFGVNDVIGCAFDANTGKIWWSKNGTWQASGDPAAGTNAAFTGLAAGTYFPAIGDGGGTSTFSAAHNFGQRSFSYTPPAGFLALNTQNLPEPSIKKPSSYFDTKLYTGNNGTLTVTGLGFSPDLVWIKNREVAGTGHAIQDTVRGATAYLFSNSTSAENTNTSNNWFRAFTSDGFTVAATTSGGTATGEWNNNGSGYVAWCWDESATPGFDIVTYTGNGTGQDVSHSLGVTPNLMIIKRRDAATNWPVYHSSYWNITNGLLFLNSTSVGNSNSGVFGYAPSSTTFRVNTDASVNASGGTYVAYLWSEVAGFSKFGSYTGNGSSDGPFVFTGFRPRWLMIKVTSISGNSWVMLDSAREPTNDDTQLYLNADSSAAESDSAAVNGYPHFFSNGFKLRGSSNGVNGSGQTYIFAAFSESAFKYSLAR